LPARQGVSFARSMLVALCVDGWQCRVLVLGFPGQDARSLPHGIVCGSYPSSGRGLAVGFATELASRGGSLPRDGRWHARMERLSPSYARCPRPQQRVRWLCRWVPYGACGFACGVSWHWPLSLGVSDHWDPSLGFCGRFGVCGSSVGRFFATRFCRGCPVFLSP
jgi:hypothetical protein